MRWPLQPKKHNSNHLSVHQWICSAIRESQQPTLPIGFLFLKLPPPPCAVLLVYIYNTSNMYYKYYISSKGGSCKWVCFAFSRFCFETPVGWQRFSWQVLSQTAWWRYIGRIPKNVIQKVGANFTQLPSDWIDKTWCIVECIVEGRRSLTIHVANKDRTRCFSVCDASLVYVVLVRQMHSESITKKKSWQIMKNRFQIWRIIDLFMNHLQGPD